MSNKGVVTFWSADAFIALAGSNVYKILTPELISRISAFVDAYILFDKVCLPERYKEYSEIKELGGEDVFTFIPSNYLRYCDDFSKGLLIDLKFLPYLTEISKEEKYWAIQHDPDAFEEIYENPDMIEEWKGVFSNMRLSLLTTMNTMIEEYGATAILHNSLVGLEKYENINNKNPDYINKCFNEFAKQYQERFIRVSRNINDDYIDTIKNFPPLLACLLDRASTNENLPTVLKQMRAEYKELRELREQYTESIKKANSVGEKRDIVELWNKSWESLLKIEFKRTGLLSRKVTSSNVVNMIFDFNNMTKIIKFLLGTVLEFDYEAKQVRQFKVFSTISKDSDKVYFNNDDIYKKFGIKGVM